LKRFRQQDKFFSKFDMVILISDENKVGKNMSTNSIYKLSGRVDGSNAGQYQFEISNLVKTGSQSFTIDLSELVYISSVGLRVFLKTAKDLQVQNRKFILSKPNSEILGLLLMSGFDKIISIEN
jgi:anti-sigma B factor antagonist